ncbi:MAG TPA: FMN-binding negative transcriptional regulator [Pseudonocardiaceae bacterium]|jgi:transcriptional regulator|nr:FMN-binding negative transcriptional regulator [Pseudonocardiaceae bacterium]
MLIHPWDAADDAEWRAWLADGHDFGQLIAVDDDYRPMVTPLHFQFDGTDLLRFHLARPNPIWPVLAARPRATVTVVDDYAFIPGTWRAPAGVAAEDGVPTSYFASVQLFGEVRVLHDPEEKAELLRQQLSHFQPTGDHGPVTPDGPPYGRQLPGILGGELRVREVRAKFKYGDRVGDAEQLPVAERLLARDEGRDPGARKQQLRRRNRPRTS